MKPLRYEVELRSATDSKSTENESELYEAERISTFLIGRRLLQGRASHTSIYYSPPSLE